MKNKLTKLQKNKLQGISDLEKADLHYKIWNQSDDDFAFSKIFRMDAQSREMIAFVTNLVRRTNVYVSPTYKEWVQKKEDLQLMIISLTHQLNRRIFGNSYKRKKKSIGVVPFIETKSKAGNPVDPHVHLCIRVPDQLLENKRNLNSLVKLSHNRTRFSDHQIDIQIQNENKKRLAQYNLKESVDTLDMKTLIMTNSEHHVSDKSFAH